MKNVNKYFVLIFMIVISSISHQSCKTKEGCGLEEKYNNPDMETTKRGKSNLFSKAQSKKMKKKS
ncbi:MAG: hypothetical protein IPL08_06170 [Saprospiraceae bacterium]|nr:hypothetical protein [Saprospiraceae bacterium]MBK8670183.1 hypothetical protein [Saprospiraceae bacterium]MBL0099857.1 hypothetical protein [Saprospiraceae bacterium]